MKSKTAVNAVMCACCGKGVPREREHQTRLNSQEISQFRDGCLSHQRLNGTASSDEMVSDLKHSHVQPTDVPREY